MSYDKISYRKLRQLTIILRMQKKTTISIDRFLIRRDSSDVEREATTPKSQAQQDGSSNNANQMQPNTRLYPDLPRLVGGQAGFNAPGSFGMSPFGSINQPPTPFVPFGGNQMPNRFTDPRFQPRPMTSPDRVQSLTFTNGLGRRLLSMIGIQMPDSNMGNNETFAARSGSNNQDQAANGQTMNPQEAMRTALQNSTVLNQLSRGVQSIYGNLSKMYNETVQQQLNMLQERYKQEVANSTNPWQQRMAQKIPQFFKTVAARVDVAQENLNRIIHDVMSARNGTLSLMQPQVGQTEQQPGGGLFSSIDRFLNGGQMFQPNNFFNGFNSQLGFNGPEDPTSRIGVNGEGQDDRPDAGRRPNLMQQLSYYWHNQVQPQIGMVRGQIAETWRDLTSSGILISPNPMRSRPTQTGGSAAGGQNGNDAQASSSDLVDNILKSVDMNASEYSLVEPKSDDGNQQQATQQQQPTRPNPLTIQMQNGLVNMQRELNQLWAGLSRSIQNAMANARQMLNPRPQFGFNGLDTAASTRSEEDKKNEIEIEGKIKDLTKLQRDTDAVYQVVQTRQQSVQRGPSITDRFRNFFGNMDVNGLDQLPGRVSDQVTRFGTVVTDLWNQIPERWDNFMQGGRQMPPPQQLQPDMMNGRLMATGTSTTTTTTARPSK